jgi:hypothetical protein
MRNLQLEEAHMGKGAGSDHVPVCINVDIGSDSTSEVTTTSIKQHRHTDWLKLKQLGTEKLKDWDRVRNEASNLDEAVQWLTDLLMSTRKACTTVRSEHELRHVKPEWWRPHLDQLLAEQRTIWTQLQNADSDPDGEKARHWRKMHKRLGKIIAAQTQKCTFNYWHGKCELMKTLTHDSQRWQEYKRATRATRTKLAPLHVYSDTKHVRSLHSDEEVADEIAAAFSARHSVNQDHYRGNQARLERVDAATNEATCSVRKRLHETNLAYPDQIEKRVCAEDVTKIISKLRNSKAGGVDGVKARVITTLKEPLSQVLADVANWSVATAYWPSKWKLALVSPLAKTDVPRSGSDFRPVSLLPLLSKIVESSVEKIFQAWCVEEEIIPKEQDGYVRGCDGHLQRVYTKARKAIRNKNHSALLLFDIAGAFDCVWHKALLYKLLLLDAPRQLVLWLSHYLHERRYQVHESRGSEITDVDGGKRCTPRSRAKSPAVERVPQRCPEEHKLRHAVVCG